MKTIKIFKLPKGNIDVHIDGDIFIENPKDKRMYYAGSLVDKDLDENGIIVSINGKYVKIFCKLLKKIL